MFEFFMSPGTPSNVWWIILLTGVVTYITRSGGYVVLSRFKNLHPRAEAALEAVPAAVLISLVLPPVLGNGPLEIVAILAACLASLRLTPIWVLAIGMTIVIVGRTMGL